MKTKTSPIVGWQTKDWVVTIGLAAVYIALYVGAFAFATEHSKIGNLVLGFLAFVGIGVSYYLMTKVNDFLGPSSWDPLWKLWCWTAAAFAVGTIGHIVGAFFVPAPDAQLGFTYSLLVALVAAPVLRVIKYSMEAPKYRWEEVKR